MIETAIYWLFNTGGLLGASVFMGVSIMLMGFAMIPEPGRFKTTAVVLMFTWFTAVYGSALWVMQKNSIRDIVAIIQALERQQDDDDS